MSSSKAGGYLQINESKLVSTVLDVEVYIPGFVDRRNLGMEVA